jgi:hypothetical protein
MKTIRPAVLLGLAVLAAASCGHKGAILEPLTPIPKSVESLAAGQRGGLVLLQWTAPSAFIDGRALPSAVRTEIWLMRNNAEESALPLEWEKEEDFMEKSGLLAVLDPYSRLYDEKTAATPPPPPDSAPLQTIRWEATMTPADAEAARLIFGVRVLAGRKGASNFAYTSWAPRKMPAPPGGLRADVFEDRIEIQWTIPDANTDGTQPPLLKGYNVYRSSPGEASARLNETPVETPPFADRSFKFGITYSYRVRALTGDAAPYLESGDSGTLDVTAVDTFPPAPPKGLISVTAVGLVTLFWNPGPEADLAGYRVWRKGSEDVEFLALTPAAIGENTFSDEHIESGQRYEYAVTAVDQAGNESARSEALTEIIKDAGT